MIFSECTNPECNETIICYYEAGDKPVGVYEKVICDKCGTPSYVKRISFNGETLSQAELDELGGFKCDTDRNPIGEDLQ